MCTSNGTRGPTIEDQTDSQDGTAQNTDRALNTPHNLPVSNQRVKVPPEQVNTLFKELKHSLRRSARVIDSMHGSQL